jgi:pimeloyl-ACP methyl ester carboxylesterase
VLAAKYPQQVKSLSLHDGWTKTDLFVKTVVEGLQVMVRGSGSVTETVIQGIFPWCFTPELNVAKPDYIESLAAFVRGRPAQPVNAFMRQSNAVIAHDVEAHLGKITAPTQVTCGRYDYVWPLRHGHGPALCRAHEG